MRTGRAIPATIAALFLLLVGTVGAVAAEPAEALPAVEVHAWKLARYWVGTTVEAQRDDLGVISDEVTDDTFYLAYRISMNALARLSAGRCVYAEAYIDPWLPAGTLWSLYLDTPSGPGAKVRVGKSPDYTFGLTPVYGTRKFSDYSPVEAAFTADPVLGLQYLQTRGHDCLGVGVVVAMRPGATLVGLAADAQLNHPAALFNTVVPQLADLESADDRSGQLEASARYARRFRDITVGLSGRVGAMDQADADFLAETFPTYPGLRTRTRYGLDATFCRAPLYATAQYYVGDTGGIGTTGWQVLVGTAASDNCSIPLRDGSPACKGLFVRYGRLTIDVPKTLDTITWDTQQLGVSYVWPLHTDFAGGLPQYFQFEYQRNTEDPPAGASPDPQQRLLRGVRLWVLRPGRGPSQTPGALGPGRVLRDDATVVAVRWRDRPLSRHTSVG